MLQTNAAYPNVCFFFFLVPFPFFFIFSAVTTILGIKKSKNLQNKFFGGELQLSEETTTSEIHTYKRRRYLSSFNSKLLADNVNIKVKQNIHGV